MSKAQSSAKTSLYVIAGLLIVFGAYLLSPLPAKNAQNATTASQSQPNEISYMGVEGKNAMDLLKASHQVETKHYDFGDMVQSIDGITPASDQFWAFYVNGQASQVGADAYQTKASDTISWKLDKIQ